MQFFEPLGVCEVSSADEVQAFDAGETCNLTYDHLLARGAAVLAVDVEVSDHPQVSPPTLKFLELSLPLPEEQQTVFFADIFKANFKETLYFF